MEVVPTAHLISELAATTTATATATTATAMHASHAASSFNDLRGLIVGAIIAFVKLAPWSTSMRLIFADVTTATTASHATHASHASHAAHATHSSHATLASHWRALIGEFTWMISSSLTLSAVGAIGSVLHVFMCVFFNWIPLVITMMVPPAVLSPMVLISVSTIALVFI